MSIWCMSTVISGPLMFNDIPPRTFGDQVFLFVFVFGFFFFLVLLLLLLLLLLKNVFYFDFTNSDIYNRTY